MLVFPAELVALRLGLRIAHRRPQPMCPWRSGEGKVVNLFSVSFALHPLLPLLPCFICSFLPPSTFSFLGVLRCTRRPVKKESAGVKCFDLCGRFCQYSDPGSWLFNQPSHTFPLGLADLSQKTHAYTHTHTRLENLLWIVREPHLAVVIFFLELMSVWQRG